MCRVIQCTAQYIVQCSTSQCSIVYSRVAEVLLAGAYRVLVITMHADLWIHTWLPYCTRPIFTALHPISRVAKIYNLLVQVLPDTFRFGHLSLAGLITQSNVAAIHKAIGLKYHKCGKSTNSNLSWPTSPHHNTPQTRRSGHNNINGETIPEDPKETMTETPTTGSQSTTPTVGKDMG